MGALKRRLLVSDILGRSGRAALRARDEVEAVAFPNLIGGDDFNALLRASGPVDGVILGPTAFGAREIRNAPSLEVVSRIGVGFDAIDVPALTRAGIPLMVTGGGNAGAVAEHTIHFLLALAKGGDALRRILDTGGWAGRCDAWPGEVAGKLVLVVGFGRIGSRVARLCAALDMRVEVYDPHVAPEAIERAGAVPAASLPEAAAACDYLTLHCPKAPDTVGLVDAGLLGRMKPGACLINTARGGVVDEAALCDALAGGRLRAAAVDVFASEPPAPDHPLLRLPNVIASPHVAGVTRESVERMAVAAVGNVLDLFRGRPDAGNVINPEALASTRWPT